MAFPKKTEFRLINNTLWFNNCVFARLVEPDGRVGIVTYEEQDQAIHHLEKLIRNR